MSGRWLLILGLLLLLAPFLAAVDWQYRVLVQDNGVDKDASYAYLWIPPDARVIRGLVVATLCETEVVFCQHPSIRAACARNDLAIVFFYTSFNGTFDYSGDLDPGSTFDTALAALATLSGYEEIAHAPYLAYGHSTGGLFVKNLAYWRPQRMISALYFKSGNLEPPEWDPTASIAGIPWLGINGQYEEFGPDGPHTQFTPPSAWESNWWGFRETLQAHRAVGDPFAQLVEPGAGHMALSTPVAAFMAGWIDAIVPLRVPDGAIARTGPITLRAIDLAAGWLADAAQEDPVHATASWAVYTGDPATAMWFPDATTAAAATTLHADLGLIDQIVRHTESGMSGDYFLPKVTFAPAADGVTVTASAAYRSTYPAEYPQAGDPVGNGGADILFTACRGAVIKTGAATFCVDEDHWPYGLDRFTREMRLLASGPPTGGYRRSEHVVRVTLPLTNIGGTAQTVTMDSLPDSPADAFPLAVVATNSSGEDPVLIVRHGPARVDPGPVLSVDGIPPFAVYPIDVRLVASHWGRLGTNPLQTAIPVERVVQITAKPATVITRVVTLYATEASGGALATDVSAHQGDTILYHVNATTHAVDRLLANEETTLQIVAEAGAGNG